MKTIKILILLLLITACNTTRAVYDYDQTADFSKFQTFNFYPDLRSGLNQLDEERLISAISEGLQEKGISLSEEPDFYVNFYATEFESQLGNNLGIGVGGGGGNVGVGISGGIPIGGPETFLRLTIDFIEARKDSLIWQAVVEGKVQKNVSPEKRTQQLGQLVEKALEGYPPKN